MKNDKYMDRLTLLTNVHKICFNYGSFKNNSNINH